LALSGQILNEIVPDWIQLGDKQQVIIFSFVFLCSQRFIWRGKYIDSWWWSNCCRNIKHHNKLLYVWYKCVKYIGFCAQKSTEINSVSTCILKLPRKMAYMSWKWRIGVLILMQLGVRQKPMCENYTASYKRHQSETRYEYSNYLSKCDISFSW
jgi:hypothetical protein